jgi:hypothetical protein
MNSGESPGGWSDFDIQRLIGASFIHPIVTEEEHTACEDVEVRVEHNAVRNVATDERWRAIRVVPRDDSRYAAVVVPVLLDGRLLLVGRYRYAANRWSIEFPRFASQTSDSGWKHSATSNLLKDAGLKATKMTLLGAVAPDPALLATGTIVILAEGCVQRAARPANPRKLIAGSVAMSPDELSQLIRRGEILCGVTLAAIAFWAAHARH